jgi:hypothetical protein
MVWGRTLAPKPFLQFFRVSFPSAANFADWKGIVLSHYPVESGLSNSQVGKYFVRFH